VTFKHFPLTLLAIAIGCGSPDGSPTHSALPQSRATSTTTVPERDLPPPSTPSPTSIPVIASMPADQPFRIGGEIVAPVIIKRVQPDYSKLRDRRIQAPLLVYEATITSAGEVASARALRPVDPEIDAPVIAALRQWRFRPATRNGRPVAVYFTLTVKIDVQ